MRVHRTPFRPLRTELKGFGSRRTVAARADGVHDPPVAPRFTPKDVLRETLSSATSRLRLMGPLPCTPGARSRGCVPRPTLARSADREGGPSRSPPATTTSHPRFSPDGPPLLFLSTRSGKSQPWVSPVGRRRAEPSSPSSREAPAQPNGPPTGQLARARRERRQPFPRGRPGGPDRPPHPDLNWRLDLAGIREQFTSLWAVPSRGGRPRRLTDPRTRWVRVLVAGFQADRVRGRPTARGGRSSKSLRPGRSAASGGRPTKLAALGRRDRRRRLLPEDSLAMLGLDKPTPGGWENIGLWVKAGRSKRRLGTESTAPSSRRRHRLPDFGPASRRR